MRRIFDDQLFAVKLSPFEQNVLKWATLLHDIDKNADPFIFSKDHVHPFNSGIAALVIFEKMKIIKLETEEHKHLFAELI